MYRHEKSDKCKFNKSCRNKLCPFQHDHHEIIEKEASTGGKDHYEIVDNSEDENACEMVYDDDDSDNDDLNVQLVGKCLVNQVK